MRQSWESSLRYSGRVQTPGLVAAGLVVSEERLQRRPRRPKPADGGAGTWGLAHTDRVCHDEEDFSERRNMMISVVSCVDACYDALELCKRSGSQYRDLGTTTANGVRTPPRDRGAF